MSNRPDYKISCTVKTKPEYLAFVFLKNQSEGSFVNFGVFWYQVTEGAAVRHDVPAEVILSEPYYDWDTFIHITQNNLYLVSKNGDNVSVTGKTALRRGNSNASWSNYNDISALTVGNFSSGNTREVFVALQW